MARWTEADIDPRMGRLLLIGVSLATAVMLIGGVVFLVHNGKGVADYKTFQKDAAPMEGSEIIRLAVLMMIATPVARVLFAVYAFARIRDWLYAGISAVVLGLLIFAIVHNVG